MVVIKLGIHQIARGLNLPVTTVDRWIRQGRIPAQKSGQEITFDAAALEKWAATHHLPFSLPDTEKPKKQTKNTPGSLLEAMQQGGVFHNVAGHDIPTALASAVALVPGLSDPGRRTLYDTLMEREKMTSTGIGKGVAIPHPRAPLADSDERPQITTCFLDQSIDYNAIDDKPVFALFILLSPSVRVHLHLLSRLAFCIRDRHFIDFLRPAPTADALFDKIAAFEKDLDRSETVHV